MNMEADNQLLRDENIRPTDEVIAEGLGGAAEAFAGFTRGLKQDGITLMEWRYYNDGKAWLSKGEYRRTTPRGAVKITPVFWLSIWDGFFKVSFFFAESARAGLLGLPLSADVKELIENAKPMGKTARFMPVILDIKDERQLNDVYILARFKKTLK